ncbi:MAG: potassium-transporting ATPase subunit B, partial [Ilumatobacteraceae bacterium]
MNISTIERSPKVRTRPSASRSMFDPTIVRGALIDCVRKLDPRVMVRNPVMFVVEIGSALSTVLLVRDFSNNSHSENVFTIVVTAWLWFTVLFANFAEAMAEGRGKAQAATLRKTRAETIAHVQLPDGSIVERPSALLQIGDLCVVSAGEV